MNADEENQHNQRIEQLTAKKIELQMENRRLRSELETMNNPRPKKHLADIIKESRNGR